MGFLAADAADGADSGVRFGGGERGECGGRGGGGVWR